MRKLILSIAVLSLVACSPDREVVDVVKGDDGADGASCLVKEIEGGLSLDCGNGSFVVTNGSDGQDGVDGQDGADGVDGQDGTSSGTLSQLTLNGCTSIGDGLYAKLIGQGSLKLYLNNTCSGNGVASLSSTDEIHVLSGGNLLVFESNNNVLYKLTLN